MPTRSNAVQVERLKGWLDCMPLELILKVLSYLDTFELLQMLHVQAAWISPLQHMLLSDGQLWRGKVFRPESVKGLHVVCSDLFRVFQGNLMGLDLGHIEDFKEGASLLAGMLSKFVRLTSLSLVRSRLSLTCVSSLFASLPSTHLVELNLSHCAWLDDATWRTLFAPAIHWPSLTRLNVSCCISLTDACLEHAFDSQHALFSRLSHLDLSGCSFSNEALIHFLPRLQDVSLLSLSRLPQLSYTALYTSLTQCTVAEPLHTISEAHADPATTQSHSRAHVCSALLDRLRFLDLRNSEDMTRQEIEEIRTLRANRSPSWPLYIAANPKLEDRSEHAIAAFLKLFCHA